MDRVVGIGEYIISSNKNDIIKTFALGSCVALTVYSPLKGVAGMVHIALPYCESTNDIINPRTCYYADKAIPFLINEICLKHGCLRNELKIKLFGGADSLRTDDVFKIGKRNLETVKMNLTKLNLRYSAEEVGGTYSRTVYIIVATGEIEVISQSMII